MASRTNFLVHAFVWLALATMAFALSPKFYDKVCPQALPAIKKIVQAAVHKERRMGASLLRLHFHDCFVNVCSLFNSKCFLSKKFTLFQKFDALYSRAVMVHFFWILRLPLRARKMHVVI